MTLVILLFLIYVLAYGLPVEDVGKNVTPASQSAIQWTRLCTIPVGAVFANLHGVVAIKTGETSVVNGLTWFKCTIWTSGQEVYFADSDTELVRLISNVH